MALENAISQEQAVLAVNDIDGTKLDANSDNDEDKTAAPNDSYPSSPSKENMSTNDKKRPAEYELFLLSKPTSSPFLLPVPADKKAKTHTREPPSFDNMTVDNMMSSDLKMECIMRGLKVHGTKVALLERLQNPVVAAASRRHKGGLSPARVDAALKVAGYETPEKASLCAKMAIQKDIILLRYGLDQVMATWECIQCHQTVQATLRQCLDQPDFGGHDYQDGNPQGALQCQDCRMGQYVTNICSGGFEVTTGKFHNHCTECDGLGKCLGDYREMHCGECQGHFFTGLSGFPCPCAERQGDMAGVLCGMGTAEAGFMFHGLSDDEYSEVNDDAQVASLLDDMENDYKAYV
eukprot:scaffold2102_cov161-Amphora_coffeaeformis.AAC.21